MVRRWESDSREINIPKVYILRSEIEYIEEYVRRKFPNSQLETGGVLLGKKIKNGSIVIIKATDAGPKAEHYAAEFSPDIGYAQKILNECRKDYDIYWIGTWHKHPNHLNRPSGGDIKQMEQFIDDKDTLDEFIALIITKRFRSINTNMFYMDKSKRFYQIDFEIIDEKSSLLKELEKIPTREEDIKQIHESRGYIKKPFPKKQLPPFISALWNKTDEGKIRLRNEVNEIQKLPFVNKVETYEGETYEGDEFLTIKINFLNYPYIMFICPPEYPLNPPTIVYSDEYKEFESCYVQGWNSLSRLADILEKIVENEKIFKGVKRTHYTRHVREKSISVEGVKDHIRTAPRQTSEKNKRKKEQNNHKSPRVNWFQR